MKKFLCVINALCTIYWFSKFILYSFGNYQPDNFTIGVLFILTILNFLGLFFSTLETK